MEEIRTGSMSTLSWSLSADSPPAGYEDTGGRWEYGVVADFEDDEHFVRTTSGPRSFGSPTR